MTWKVRVKVMGRWRYARDAMGQIARYDERRAAQRAAWNLISRARARIQAVEIIEP